MLELASVVKRYPGHSGFALNGLSFSVSEGQCVALVGPSGCGKTTTLRAINRLEAIDAGRITLAGDDILALDPVRHRRACGYVIQEVGLLPHWNVADNVGTVPRLCGWPRAEIEARVTELLDAVGLPPAEYATRRPSQLSGGERQRVGIARALAARPRLLLMDEPFGALDPLTRAELHGVLGELRAREQPTVVLVTHDLAEALELAERVVVLRDGRVAQAGTPEELRANPADPWVARFLSSVLHAPVGAGVPAATCVSVAAGGGEATESALAASEEASP